MPYLISNPSNAPHERFIRCNNALFEYCSRSEGTVFDTRARAVLQVEKMGLQYIIDNITYIRTTRKSNGTKLYTKRVEKERV